MKNRLFNQCNKCHHYKNQKLILTKQVNKLLTKICIFMVLKVFNILKKLKVLI